MNYQTFLNLALKRYPKLQIREKTTWWWLTLGFFFPLLKSNFTTLYTTIWVPISTKLEESPYGLQVLSHEVCHMDQIYYGGWRRIQDEYPMEKPRGFFHASLFYFLYLLWPLPTKLATFRARVEMEAFLREYNQEEGVEIAGPEKVTEAKKRNCLYYMTGPYYFWAVTEKKAEEIFNSESAKILRRDRES